MEYRIVHAFPESYRVEKKVWYGWKKRKFKWIDAVFDDPRHKMETITIALPIKDRK